MAFTYFFRDLQTLEMICEHALPELRARQYLNIWDAGCAMGPEPFTLAMLIKEQVGNMYYKNVRITATDIDGSDLFDEMIKNAAYPYDQVERIPKNMFEKYFIPAEEEGYYKLIEEVRRAVTFTKHDLLTLEPVGTEFGLIVCKNVLLHFSEQQRVEVIKMFHDSLIDGGYLAMEQTQKLPEQLSNLFEQVVSNAQLYKKRKK